MTLEHPIMKKNNNRVARRAYVEELAVARVGMKLAAALDESDKNQKDIAEALGVSEARMSQIFNGEENLRIKTVARIADALGQEFEPQFSLAHREVPRLAESAQTPNYTPHTSRDEGMRTFRQGQRVFVSEAFLRRRFRGWYVPYVQWHLGVVVHGYAPADMIELPQVAVNVAVVDLAGADFLFVVEPEHVEPEQSKV